LKRGARFLDSVEADLVSIAWHIATQSNSAEIAVRFTDALRRRCEDLARLPGTLGTARPEFHRDLRSVPHKNYVIFFRYAEDTVEIVNILHGRRDVIAHYDPEPE
jgi:plasmid stabilization system protein ParE